MFEKLSLKSQSSGIEKLFMSIFLSVHSLRNDIPFAIELIRYYFFCDDIEIRSLNLSRPNDMFTFKWIDKTEMVQYAMHVSYRMGAIRKLSRSEVIIYSINCVFIYVKCKNTEYTYSSEMASFTMSVMHSLSSLVCDRCVNSTRHPKIGGASVEPKERNVKLACQFYDGHEKNASRKKIYEKF